MDLALDDTLEDFERRSISLNGAERTVYQLGQGRAVIVMHEMPGITPHVARFARWTAEAGFTVYMPSLFGRDGAVVSADEGATIFRRACMSAKFRAFGGNVSSPVTDWLRALARMAHAECGGPGVGAIGMCFTGNFALTMMLEPSVLAPVLAQPSLPMDVPGGLESSPEELADIRRRLEKDDLTVRAYRFDSDSFCRAERFAAYQEALGPRFEPTVLPGAAANTRLPPFAAEHVRTPHSVVTTNLVDEEGHPTIAARDRIILFFQQRLTTPDI